MACISRDIKLRCFRYFKSLVIITLKCLFERLCSLWEKGVLRAVAQGSLLAQISVIQNGQSKKRSTYYSCKECNIALWLRLGLEVGC